MSEALWQRKDRWVGAEVDDSFVMVDIETGKYVALNPTALAIWNALETPADEDELCRMLIAKFEVEPEECRRAVAAVLDRMRELDLAAAA